MFFGWLWVVVEFFAVVVDGSFVDTPIRNS